MTSRAYIERTRELVTAVVLRYVANTPQEHAPETDARSLERAALPRQYG